MTSDKKVFVTVGTTLFDELIDAIHQENILKLLKSQGYKHLVLQIGQGTIVPKEGLHSGLNVEVFRYRPSLKEVFAEADLVISHGGAGSCMEALEAGKSLVVVINKKLMNNHQSELAEALYREGYCQWCYPDTLYKTLRNFNSTSLTSYTPGKPEKLASYVTSKFSLNK